MTDVYENEKNEVFLYVLFIYYFLKFSQVGILVTFRLPLLILSYVIR